MADDFTFTPGTGATGAAKNIGGVLYPQVIATEIDGSDTGLASKLGPVTETAPATDTASSGLNGRLQRIAQNITTLIGSTITVTGTFWQSVQPVSGTFWQATQPVSAASLPLPTGAAQDATLTGGTQQSKITDGTHLATVKAASTAAVATDTALVVAVSPNNTIPVSIATMPSTPVTGTVTANAGTNLNTSALALETGGNLATLAGAVSSSKMATKAASGDFADGAITTMGLKADAKNSASDTTSISIMSVLKQISFSIQAAAASLAGTLTVATHAVTQSGTWTVATNADGVTGSTVPSKGLLVQGSDGTDARNVATTTAGVVKVDISATAVNSTAIKVDGSGVTQPVSLVTNTPVIAAGSNIIGKVGIDQTTVGTTNGVTPVPAATGGPTVQRVKAAASTNATSVKTSAGQIYGWALFNTTASELFVKIYNKASSPTVGTDTPAFTIPVPASGGTNIEFSMGIPLGTGIAFAITGAITDTDTTTVALDSVHGLLLYK